MKLLGKHDVKVFFKTCGGVNYPKDFSAAGSTSGTSHHMPPGSLRINNTTLYSISGDNTHLTTWQVLTSTRGLDVFPVPSFIAAIELPPTAVDTVLMQNEVGQDVNVWGIQEMQFHLTLLYCNNITHEFIPSLCSFPLRVRYRDSCKT